MPFKTFTAGTLATASDVNTYLMNQAVMTFASASDRNTALTAPTEGMVVYLQNNDHFQIYNGTDWVTFDIAWNAWTPTFTNLTQGTGATTSAFYARVGKTIVAQVYVTMGTSPTVNGQFSISLPVDIASSNRSLAIGTCLMRDAGALVSHIGSVFAIGSAPSVVRMQAVNTTGNTGTLSSQSVSVPFTWSANAGNYFSFTIMYQGV